jgi:cytochrome P450
MADEDGRDPLDELNRVLGGGSPGSPYPRLAELRHRGPVHPIDLERLRESVGGEAGPEALGPPVHVYAAVSHAAVSRVLLDAATFSSRSCAATTEEAVGPSIFRMDEPEHRLPRGLVQQAFTPDSLARWETGVARPVAARRVDRFAARGRADLVHDLTLPFAFEVVARMLGIPEPEHESFHRLAVGLIGRGSDRERGLAAAKSLAERLRPLVEARRARPSDDLIGALTLAELEGARLPDREILAFLSLLVAAAAETTCRSISNLLFALLTHSDQLDAVRDDRSLLDPAIEEGLRWEAPLTGLLRVATRDAEVCGETIPEGALVVVSLGSANRDEARYQEPERFNLFREPRQHAAFGYGPHACPGSQLARSESRILLETLLDRLPGLRLDPEAEGVEVRGRGVRSPCRLPVLFDV